MSQPLTEIVEERRKKAVQDVQDVGNPFLSALFKLAGLSESEPDAATLAMNMGMGLTTPLYLKRLKVLGGYQKTPEGALKFPREAIVDKGRVIKNLLLRKPSSIESLPDELDDFIKQLEKLELIPKD